MESGVRKKRTLAERRESDKLRQRRFRAKKREEALLIQSINGTAEKEKKERVCSIPKKTADEIRETNRIRQQRFRAKKRVEGLVEMTPEPIPILQEPPVEQKLISISLHTPTIPIEDNTVNLVQRILLQAASDEKTRQTEIRREKDRIRKRRERQRKKDRALKLAGLSPEDVVQQSFEKKLAYLQQDMEESYRQETPDCSTLQESDNEDVEDDDYVVEEEVAQIEEEDVSKEYFDASKFVAQLEEMGLVLGVMTPSNDTGSPMFEIKQKSPEESISSEESTSSTSSTPYQPETSPFPEKKQWQRCNSSEERRERERMRKRMYRAKQKFISTGKLEMQWNPAPIKRSPNDEPEEGITPLPEWQSGLSSDQKLVAHRIYNKRYRERMKSSAVKDEASRSQSREEQPLEPSETLNFDLSTLPPDLLLKQMLSTISKCDFSGIKQDADK
ncbi:Ribosome biogenesis protein NOP53 [Caenorhabditis elegans]|uniref:Ribosome biogenesis protein NOP53 n=1 Tax=Caenorhabditis elegans TaxID=6239 RepID=Q22671_CAEEL|nr:Ribosome biogenesis protein NOP53 [Caenorhabditis elegans]CAA99927.2 Ribosome biogenesis protein NOP53 [Caenorhabditis elegans]|eukprot:NP_492197.1 Uncharacterized protein CELE_T22C1.11 [Caenorhabditis elegans]